MKVKTLPVSVRLAPEVKAALERASKDDTRSLSSMIEKVLSDWLHERGYMKAGAGQTRPK